MEDKERKKNEIYAEIERLKDEFIKNHGKSRAESKMKNFHQGVRLGREILASHIGNLLTAFEIAGVESECVLIILAELSAEYSCTVFKKHLDGESVRALMEKLHDTAIDKTLRQFERYEAEENKD